MIENEIFEEELENRFAFYDNQHNGVVSQAQFKDVMNSIGIILTLPELIKAVRSLGTSKNEIKYSDVVERLKGIEVTEISKQ
jgi:Ca2+-binding EF-hand superfamily protein